MCIKDLQWTLDLFLIHIVSLQAHLLSKSLQLMLMIRRTGTVLKLYIVSYRGSLIFQWNQKQVRIAFWSSFLQSVIFIDTLSLANIFLNKNHQRDWISLDSAAKYQWYIYKHNTQIILIKKSDNGSFIHHV